MGIQAVIVFIGVIVALMVGIVAGTSDLPAPLTGWLAVGLLPVIWTALHLIERFVGHEIWRYRAPYPYPSMQGAPARGEAAVQDVSEREGGDVTPVKAERRHRADHHRGLRFGTHV